VLDLLGHVNVKVLDGGIDAWKRAGLETVNDPAEREAVAYQAPPEELKPTARIAGSTLYDRLGDQHYQVLDVRSQDEYLGEAPNADWQGRALKLGHVPGAYNVNYEDNWVDTQQKLVKAFPELQRLYAGLDPRKAVVIYCHSGRRSSHTYFILRLIGFSDVRLYDYSWNEWGKKSLYYPVETKENVLIGIPPTAVSANDARPQHQTQQPADRSGQGGGKSGYISCGG
jgi:thiosulfate/3-mercaptopyruvate sulfurtransferase